MKKILFIVTLTVLLFASLPSYAADNEYIVKVDGQVVTFADAKPFVDANNRALMPVRYFSEKLGATVDWDENSQTVTIKRGSNTLVLTVGKNNVKWNGFDKPMDTQVMAYNNRVYIPLRAVCIGIGASVVYDGENNTALINSAPDNLITQDHTKGAGYTFWHDKYSDDYELLFVYKDTNKINFESFESLLGMYFQDEKSISDIMEFVAECANTGNGIGRPLYTSDGRAYDVEKLSNGINIFIGYHDKTYPAK